MLKLHKLFRLHRALGAAAAAVVLVLAVSGVLLNHTDDLHLQQHRVRSPALLAWYGIHPPPAPLGFRAGGHWVSLMGEQVYRDATPLEDTGPGLLGAVAVPRLLVVAQGDRLILLDAAGQRVETLRAGEGVPPGVSRIGTREGRVVVATEHGDYIADAELLQWQPAPPGVTAWSRAQPLPAGLEAALTARYVGPGLSWERVLLDLHSGRILGRPGEILVDLAAAAMLFLAVSGVFMWWRMRRARARARS